jgi:hypothetical protein
VCVRVEHLRLYLCKSQKNGSGVCKCFKRMLQVSSYFQTYVSSVSSGCFKDKCVVAHVTMGPTYRAAGASS